MRIFIPVLVLLVAGSGRAEPDTFYLGTGKDGSLRLDSGSRVVNRYARLTADAASGTSDLTVSDSTGFAAGDLVLVHQSAGLAAPDSGNQNPLDLGSGPVGRIEYARVASVSSGVIRLTAPLLYAHAGNLSQVVSVPEYTDLDVRSGASLRAAPWDGSVGGILAVMVTGRLRNDGLFTVDGAGFRGGAFLSHADLNGCTGLDEPVASGGAYKGEGLVAGRFGSASGRGNLANGGGGGICHNSGGGGGGHAGLGGRGGRSAPADGEQDVGGLGGAPLVYLPYEYLVFGGGGGAGEGNNDEGSGGGAGGGLMLLRATEVRGGGRFSAAGATPPPTPGDDGAGGGGAGGAISIRTVQELECGAVEARGGAGGDNTERIFPLAPGGGGAGGVVFLQGEVITCSRSVLAGEPGHMATDGGTHGAGPDSVDGGTAPGSAQALSIPFDMPPSPVLTLPVDGATQVGLRLHVEGRAQAGDQRVLLFLDGVLLSPLVPGADGRFSYDRPGSLPPGRHELSAFTESLGVHSLSSAPVVFTAVPGGPPDAGVPGEGGGNEVPGVIPPLVLAVGCGCGSAPGAGLWAGAVLVAALAARRRRKP
ncbi:MYXO-CTERM sorting domain-containing protein [Archangium gephyra]|uniref:adventurous gliding motility protein AgmC n=1 Tax=Archangium gephyra TaxID=48 RepID=UPI0035D41800